MADIKIDLQFYCANCGMGICHKITQDKRHIENISVDLCDNCIDKIKQEAYDKGYSEAEKYFNT